LNKLTLRLGGWLGDWDCNEFLALFDNVSGMRGNLLLKHLFNTVDRPTDDIFAHPILYDNARRRTPEVIAMDQQVNVFRPVLHQFATNAKDDSFQMKDNSFLVDFQGSLRSILAN